MRTPLRVAVMLGRRDVRAWHRRAVDAVRAVPGARVERVLVVNGPPPSRERGGDPGLAPIALDAIAGDAVVLDAGHPDAPASVPDVVLDLADARPAGAPPRFGTWRYAFGDGGAVADGAAGTLARLVRDTPAPGHAIVLHEGWFRARSAEAAGTASVALRVAPWAARAVRQLLDGTEPAGSAQTIADTPLASPPDDTASWRTRAIDAALRWLTRERWTIGVVRAGYAEILDRGRLPEPAWLAGQPRDRFYADPFVLGRAGDRLRVLVEDYRYRQRRGRVTELEIDPSGAVHAARDGLALSEHLSYPFVLHDAGETFCVPEIVPGSRVAAYATAPTGGWPLRHTLLDDFPAADPTLVQHDGRWWLFCTHRDDENQTDLYLFSAPAWTGPWTPHPLNPVKSDARGSRPAGACFTLDGALYRPAQNCARRYGGALTIHRVLELSPRAFREEPVASLAPTPSSPWPAGLHTLNALDGVAVVDGLRVERAR